MSTAQTSFEVHTFGRSLVEFTDRVRDVVTASKIATGLANIFVHHTSASLLINENADPDVVRDLLAYFDRLVPDGDRLYRHTDEGPDDMPAHVRSVLTGASISVPVTHGHLGLGTWQGIFLFEHRHAPHRRRITVTVQGD